MKLFEPRNRSSMEPAAASPRHGHLGEPEIAVFVDAMQRRAESTLPPGLVQHVEECSSCRDAVLDVFLFLESEGRRGGALPSLSVPATVAGGGWWKIAASLAVVGISLGVYLFMKPRPSVPDAPQAAPVVRAAERVAPVSAPAPAATPAPAAAAADRPAEAPRAASAFAVNPNLEGMIGARLRGSNLVVSSPHAGETVTREEILFAWEPVGAEPLALIVLNNRNESLHEYTAASGRLVFRERLAPGLYYWKLQNRTDLLYVGKFVIPAVNRTK